MRSKFVETSNVKRYMSALTRLEKRGAVEACLVVVDGVPGLGKTTTLMHWVAQSGSIYLRAKKKWDANWFLVELLESLRVQVPHSFRKKFAKALEELQMRHHTARLEGRSFALVIDEADHVSSKSEILETIRDLSDAMMLPTVLVGMGKINDHLTRFPQVASRVSQRVRFEKTSLEDVRLFIDELCEVKVADDLCKFVLTVSDGFNREVMESIANIERFGLRMDVGEDGLTMADMAGEVIVTDRRSSAEIKVPEAL